MKKFLALAMALFLFAIAGCGSSPEKICEVAGLGDSKEAWQADHGKPNRDNGSIVVNYKDDKYLVCFTEKDVAMNVTLQPINHKPDEQFKKMLPKDIKKVSTNTDNRDSMLFKEKECYTSESLAKKVPSSKGKITVIHIYDKKTGDYLQGTYDCTPSLEDLKK